MGLWRCIRDEHAASRSMLECLNVGMRLSRHSYSASSKCCTTSHQRPICHVRDDTVTPRQRSTRRAYSTVPLFARENKHERAGAKAKLKSHTPPSRSLFNGTDGGLASSVFLSENFLFLFTSTERNFQSGKQPIFVITITHTVLTAMS